MDVRVLVLYALQAYRYTLFVRIILSWFPIAQSLPPALRPAFAFLHDLTEPFLRLFRRILPPIGVGGMGLDLSPLLGFIVIYIAEAVAVRALFPA
jgi:YggT family protein